MGKSKHISRKRKRSSSRSRLDIIEGQLSRLLSVLMEREVRLAGAASLPSIPPVLVQ